VLTRALNTKWLRKGDVLAFWGHPNETDTRHNNNTPEYFGSQSLGWQILGRESDVVDFNLGYPRVHLLPNGRVFRATPAAPPGSAESFNVEITSGGWGKLQSAIGRTGHKASCERGAAADMEGAKWEAGSGYDWKTPNPGYAQKLVTG
jgi:hypothetical protein